ncbi:hypothetical protein [Nocardiopsis trehalosi]|jgi:hypothetical protein|uniref:hypothetical protein n=1 Tax=Nocardiopsis trehalosi TaxID=109329 RepID=UPI000836FD76|nr:hypothetical protein [Nocardiopsis trehalosi]
MAILLVVAGLLLLGLAVGFLLAVSIGIRQRDRRGGYRSLRDGTDSALSLSGRRLLNLTFRTPESGGRPAADDPTDPDRSLAA